MYKAFKFRMYPDNNQKELMNKTFGISRFIYNYYLNKIKNNNYNIKISILLLQIFYLNYSK